MKENNTLSKSVIFYIVAHEDDWQIFMGADAYEAYIKDKHKIVFIYTTAGDHGRTDGYWQARESAAMSSTKALVSMAELRGSGQPPDLSGRYAVMNNHSIYRCICGNTVSYFMRLPDGGLDGNGFPAYGNPSLLKLKMAAIDSITTVENPPTTTYNSWDDFWRTLEAIILEESDRQTAPYVRVNAQDYDPIFNPSDHPDHLVTGAAVNQAADNGNSWNLVWFAGYTVGMSSQERISELSLAYKVLSFMAYDQALLNECGHSTIGENPQQYYRWLEHTRKRLCRAFPIEQAEELPELK